MAPLSVNQGVRALQDDNGFIIAYGGVVIGIILRYMYEVAIQAVKNGGIWDVGTIGIVAARLIIAFIVGIGVITSAWGNLNQIPDKTLRFFTAIVTGLAVDALIGPIVS